jgi:hypothetical protein
MRMTAAFYALVLAAATTPALAQEAIGYVAAIDGAAQITRAQQTRELLLGETIFRGDRISAEAPASVRVDTRGGSVTVCGRGVPASDCRRNFDSGGPILPAGSWWSRGVTMVSWFRSNPSNLITRGPYPPVLLLGRSKAQKLASGTRKLSVTWAQGEEPFEVRLSAGGRVLARQKTAERSITLPEVALAPGAATIAIVDKENRTTTVEFAVTVAPPVPSMTASAVNREHQVLLEAAWLASHDDGAWLFEAYQRLQLAADKVPAAAMMQRALAAGDRP